MKEEQPYSNALLENTQAASLAAQGTQAQGAAQQQQFFVEEAERTMAEAQLECEKTLNKIYHKLKQDILVPTEDGRMTWEPIAITDRVLSDEGVNKIMQVMESYVNKETLLSNFTEKKIDERMLAFCYALNSNIYMKYKQYFRLPTIDECKGILEKEIQEKIDIIKISIEMFGNVLDESKLKQKVMETFGDSLDDEIARIMELRLSENLREYELLFTQLKHMVESIHNRAWHGEERGSLRRHMNYSEVVGTQPQQQKQGGMFKWAGR